jgi:hypothetical protein
MDAQGFHGVFEFGYIDTVGSIFIEEFEGVFDFIDFFVC